MYFEVFSKPKLVQHYKKLISILAIFVSIKNVLQGLKEIGTNIELFRLHSLLTGNDAAAGNLGAYGRLSKNVDDGNQRV